MNMECVYGQESLQYNIIVIIIGSGCMSSTEIDLKKTGEGMSMNPYQLIKVMNKLILQLKDQIKEYELVFENMRKEKELLLGENRKLSVYIMQLVNKLENANQSKNISQLNFTSKLHLGNRDTKLNQVITPTNKNRKLESPSLRLFDKGDNMKSGIFDLGNVPKRMEDNPYDNEEDYIPKPIRLTKNKQENTSTTLINSTTENGLKKQYKYGENMLEAFVIIGPDIAEFKKKRTLDKTKDDITVRPAALYCHGRHYKDNKSQFIAEIAKRAFSEGCRLKKKLFEHNEELIDLIEYKPNRILSEDYFTFTLKGDESLHKSTHENPNLRKSFLYNANPNYLLFIVCLKLPDFLYIRDEKNYHRKENEIWIGEKIYAVVTYYPFFNIHTEILCRAHSIMSKIMIRKILVENENILIWNIGKTVYDVQKNEKINDMLNYFLTKKPDYNQVCYQSAYYFGTLPEYGFKSLYAMSLYCCPIFFSNFSYEEMLLMLTAILCQKTLVFLSKKETISTLSALFFINLISPFQYSETLLLNCDSERVKQMIFEFPFPMICSIKRNDDNLEEILALFAESNVMRLSDDDAQYIIVDVDSNTILYHPVLEKLFTQCIVESDKSIRQAYLSINPCQSKSFSLPKELPREIYKPNTKPKSQIEKRLEEIRRNVRQYSEKIQTNTTKIPTYRRNEKHEELLKILAQHIQQFTINNENDYEIIKKLESTHKNSRIELLRDYLISRKGNAGRERIIGRFTESQMYANYLDNILKDA